MGDQELLKGRVYLKTGQVLEAMFLADKTFNPNSFTDKSIHRFVNDGATKAFFVLGDNIAYVEIEK